LRSSICDVSGFFNVYARTAKQKHTSSGNIKSLDTLLDLVLGLVLIRFREVGHLKEGHNLDAKFVPVLLDSILGIVRAVEINALGVLARTSVVTTDNEVGSTVVLTDDGVPDGLTGTGHTHSKGQESEYGHAVRVAGHQRLVDTDTGEVINVTGLGQTNDRVDEDVGLAGASSADRQLTVSAVHGVPRLESNDLGPSKLVKVQTQLCGCVAETDIVVVLQTVDGLDLTTDIVLLDRLVEVLDGRMRDVVVLVKNLPGLLLLVWLVYVVNGEDGKVAVVAEVTEGNAGALLDADLVNGLF
jgi:hypothetical protein